MPTPHRWLIAPACACAALAACGPAKPDNGLDNAAVPENETSDSVLPVAVPPLDREALLIAAMRATSATALGRDDAEAQREFEGKRFELRIRFGCNGPTDARQPLSWRFDEPTRTLRLAARPDVSAEDPLVAAMVGKDGIEEVEGFWIPRPWLLTAACPAAPPPAAPPAESSAADQEPKEPAAPLAPPPAEQRVAIAQFFTDTDARTGRQTDRAYEAVVALAEGAAPSAEGYNLVLSGRLQALPGGKVIGCAAPAPGRRPDCIISAHIDEARMERPDNGAILARWGR